MKPPSHHHLRGKTLLVINTGSLRKRFVFQRLKKFGLRVVVVHREKNWAQQYSDDWIIADTYNHTEVIDAVRTYLQSVEALSIDGAITFWEDDIPLLAKVCSEFKWVGNSIEAAMNTRDKWRMQERFKQCGLPNITQQLLKSKPDLGYAMERIGFPAVLKPVFGSDSQFVLLVTDVEEAREAYKYLLKNCTPEYDPIYKYNRRLFLYQEYLEGPEFSVECICQYGVPHIVGIHGKRPMRPPYFMETGDVIPPHIEEEEEIQLQKAAEAALIVLGVRSSAAHVEVKLTGGGATVIEAASRMGGDYTFENVLRVHGVDLIQAACEIAFGMNVSMEPTPPQQYIISRYFIPQSSGVITKIRGIDVTRSNRSVSTFLAKEVGDTVLVPPDGYEMIGWISARGPSFASAERTLEHVLQKVRMDIAPFRGASSVGRTERRGRFSPALISKKGMLGLARIARIRTVSKKKLKSLHIGIAGTLFESEDPVEQDLMSVGKNIEKALLERGYRVTFFDFNAYPKVVEELKSSDVDIVFNAAERISGLSALEPHVAGVLDTLQIPYTGSNFFTLGLICLDKIKMKELLNHHGIPTPRWDYAYSLDDPIDEDLRYPLIVKPANAHNSIGITNDSVVENKQQLKAQLQKLIVGMKSPALIEEYIEGDEYDVPIVGNDEEDLRVLPLTRWIFKDMPRGYWHIFAYDAKWAHGKTPYSKIRSQRPPRNIGRKLESLLSELALDAYNIVDCHDYGRVELRVDREGNPYVLEANPNPSINIDDNVPAAAKLTGMDYGDFIEEILRMAIRRYKASS